MTAFYQKRHTNFRSQPWVGGGFNNDFPLEGWSKKGVWVGADSVRKVTGRIVLGTCKWFIRPGGNTSQLYARAVQKLLTPCPPPSVKTNDFFINMRSECFKALTVEVRSFFRIRFDQDGKRGKYSTFEKNLNVALTACSTSFRVTTTIPCVLSLNFENRREC